MRNDCQTANKRIAKQQAILVYNTCLVYFQLFRLVFKKKNWNQCHLANVALLVFLVDLRSKPITILSFLNREVIIDRAGIDEKIVKLAESFLLFCRDKSAYQMFFYNAHSLEISLLEINFFWHQNVISQHMIRSGKKLPEYIKLGIKNREIFTSKQINA